MVSLTRPVVLSMLAGMCRLTSCLLLLLLAQLWLPRVDAQAADAPDPEAVAFASRLKDVDWRLRGTSALKGLRFDGEALRAVNPDGSARGAYETIFPDVDIVRILFSDGTTGWYFISDDFRFITSLKVISERPFAMVPEATARPVKDFPKDIEGVVYASTDDSESNPPGKVRWNGKNLEFGVLKDGTWGVEALQPVVSNRRAFEMRASETVVVWMVFSKDGGEAWLLQVENIFGGHRADVMPRATVTARESGLTEQLNDLANHMMDLIDAGVKEPVATLQRQFERKLKDRPELLDRLKQRVSRR